MALIGTGLTAIGSGLLTTLTIVTPPPKWIGYQIIAGMGRGVVLQIVR